MGSRIFFGPAWPLLGFMTLGSASAQTAAPGKEGERLPDLRLPAIDGSETLSLAELRGTRLLLVEFASW
jgi:hypothetical protein